MVPGGGVEPPRGDKPRRILSPLRLPVPPSRPNRKAVIQLSLAVPPLQPESVFEMVLRCAAPQRRDYAAVHHYVAASLFISYTAILVLPGLKNGDLALSTMVRQTFPPWFLGVVGGAGALTVMVPCGHPDTERRAALFAKNFFRSVFKPSMKDDDIAKLAKVMAVVMAGIAVYFATYSSTTLVGLLLLAYAQRQSSTLSG